MKIKAPDARDYLTKNPTKLVRHSFYPWEFRWTGEEFQCRDDWQGDNWRQCGVGNVLFSDHEEFVRQEQ